MKNETPAIINTNKVVFFSGCRSRYLDPDVGKAVIRVLQKNGRQPVLPDQKCCATPKLACGDKKGFIKHGKFNINSLNRSVEPIVTDCTSCALTLKREYPDLLKDEASQRVAHRTYDIMEYLTSLQSSGQLNVDFNPKDMIVYYHTPCHLRALEMELVHDRIRLLRSVPGINVTFSGNGWCCGMGGTFGFKEKNFEMSMAIGRNLFEKIIDLSPDFVATECSMCKAQIEQGTGLKVIHPVEIIYKAYGFE